MITIKDLIKDYIFVSFLAFVISLILTPIIRRRCQQKHVLDFPANSRKIHTIPMPRLGGIAIYLAFFIPLFATLFDGSVVSQLFSQHLDILISLFITSTLVFAIGVYDDIRGATVLQKLSVQFGAAVLLYFLGFKIELIAVPFFGTFDLGILSLAVTIFWLVGVTNALNFIDGIDGLACGVGFFSISTMFILSLFLHHPLTAFFAAALAGGLFGFVVYNFAPASIFMGDSGSLFIGFIIAAISLQGSQKSSTAVVLLIPVVALGVPITDTILAVIRRLGKKSSPFVADKEHIHHRLLRLGLSSRQVTLSLYTVCFLLGITALLMTAVNNKVLTLILIILSVMGIGGIKMLGYTTDMIAINNLAKERIQQRKRSLERQKWIDEIVLTIQNPSDSAILKKVLIRYCENMGFDLGKFSSNILTSLEFEWGSEQYETQAISPEQLWTVTIPIMINNKKYGELLVGKHLGLTDSLAESVLLIDPLKYALEQSLLRLRRSDKTHSLHTPITTA